MNAKEFAKRSNSIFDKAFAEGKEPNDRVLWHDRDRQYFRFHEICRYIDMRRDSVLDVGCGNGELLGFLSFCGFCGKYTGVDIHSKLVGEARGRFSKADFRVLDIFDSAVETYDCVVMSGVFNANVGQDLDFVVRFITRMHELSRFRTVFNAVSTHVNFCQPEIFYIDPSELLERLLKITPQVEMRHGFLPFNFTVCMHAHAQG